MGRTVYEPPTKVWKLKEKTRFLDLECALHHFSAYKHKGLEINKRLKALNISRANIRPSSNLAYQVRLQKQDWSRFSSLFQTKVIAGADDFVYSVIEENFATGHVDKRRQGLIKYFAQKELLNKVSKSAPIEPIDFLVHSVTRKKFLLHAELLLTIAKHPPIGVNHEPSTRSRPILFIMPSRKKRKHHRKNFQLRSLITSISFFYNFTLVLLFVFRNVQFRRLIFTIIRITLMFFVYVFPIFEVIHLIRNLILDHVIVFLVRSVTIFFCFFLFSIGGFIKVL